MSREKRRVTAGNFFPLGATPGEGGVNFALYSKYADGVDLLLFDKPSDAIPYEVIHIKNKTRFVWHCFVEGIGAGSIYAYRVRGAYMPEWGLRFNPNRLLIDPYAKAITGKFDSNWCHLGYDSYSSFADLSFNSKDNAGGSPKCLVIDDGFDWEGDKPPRIPMENTIIYEVHLKSLTAHRSSQAKNPGTYLGVIEKIPYLENLGITSVEFLPVHHCQGEDFLPQKGLTNFWGYNTLGFFAPDSRYSTNKYPGSQVEEFKQMVKALHKAGIEVILDVVYNHTCEGNERGPSYSFRGIDNPTYYKLAPERRYYMDYTGCGNSLNFDEPQVIKLVMDSLRFWVEVMHVDGFRFDLASTLGREQGRFDVVSSFFTAIHQDPVLSRIKLIAEPWDIAWDSYQVGNFPIDWAEWNGKYRDCIRKFVKGDSGILPEMGYRLTGSSDLYGDDGRTPYHSINFITCHDGFSLNDLVSYANKHNEANLENNRDGNDTNQSWNWGAEGETTDPQINNLRKRLVKNFFTILMISQGVPMILGGDEFLRTQKGNNNAYCQDNETSHFDWSLVRKNNDMVEFVRKVIALRKRIPHFRRSLFFTGQDIDLDSFKDINWYNENLSVPDWNNLENRHIAFLIDGSELRESSQGVKWDIMVFLNFHWEDKNFLIPETKSGGIWYRLIDTSLPAGQDASEDEKAFPLPLQKNYLVTQRSVVVLLKAKHGD
ncbi:MAG: glycogen debranching enzyme GlgX [Candidatus Schekmanbacteria bacterium GWA2_38_9]|uniref:Glycogen debranching enzyme GlgX n=1 Tax=Candidatus Schekmanbacteria bacterium RIFCSPLOWO2_12_FULL_38_15 TaxID=1817883 RepID=A0A1F7SGZ9_9BACT|nr:MAG: glycogen debranching enzyme GlgX [Candidatus Schekmanbacteria bacterium GWA2_38_9]OGL48549.1 MAG: glycogen debranching enzyme GlgX [Candidatus Schekmanbacteria bacterium RIFCSPLOWO2_02_FULL_38_14]OGL52528.1 MAG: glycogen debranching enzyme GlgX [Candidatus Schekmanbacteria bacterium RIFCSPLOWO2_12_FULL_38_15]